MSMRKGLNALFAATLALCTQASPAAGTFKLHETSIDAIHAGIQSGEVSCKQVVEAYVARAKAYNGVCTALITPDGKSITGAAGAVRAGSPLKFPTQTVGIKVLIPDFDQYKGKTPDWGRMEATRSDPSVQQQYGMVAGIPDAGQVNGLETLNLRGERSVSCKAGCDAASGPLPASCPKACETLRSYPDAIEYAEALDKKYGRNPDLKAMPLYCAPLSFKAIYDAKDMRSTGGGDVAYAMDVAPQDSTLTARMRAAGAIIYAQAQNAEYNGGSGDPAGASEVTRPTLGQGGSRETWGGTACNPYDTARVTGGSSAGSGVSVAANLVVCSICETTGGSCRNPGTHNGVVTLVPTKGMISFGGGIGADPYRDRPGINCKSVKDAAMLLDGFRDTRTGSYFDARDIYTSLPRNIAQGQHYAAAVVPAGGDKPLKGLRIGVLRELFVKKNPSNTGISDGINRELKVLRELGAELVESVDPDYPDDPSIPNMKFTFVDAIAEIVPMHLPEVLAWTKDGKPEFEVPGYDVTSREYLVKASVHQAPWPKALNFARMMGNPPSGPDVVTGYTFAFNFAQYLALRGDAKVKDWATLNGNAKYFNDVRYTAMKNWEAKPIDARSYATTWTMKRRDAMRMAVMKVMEQNGIDVFVNPPLLTPPTVIGGASLQGGGGGSGHGYGASLGIPEVFVPAGFLGEVYDPVFSLSKDGSKYEGIEGTRPTKLKSPLPYNIAFWAGPGEEALLIKVGSAYEAATHHRKPPAAFPPLKGEP